MAEHEPQAGNDPGQAPDPDTTDDPQAGEGGSSPEELRRARSDAAKYRQQLRDTQKTVKELQEKVQADDDAKKSELQKLTERTQSLESQVREKDGRVKSLSLENAVVKRASGMGIVDPDAAYRLLDADAVEYDDNGKPTNIEDLLKDLVEAKPYLRGKANDPDNPKSKSDTSTTLPNGKKKTALSHSDIEKMSDDEINARWDEVQLVLAQSRN